jgi:hypothetical protein
MSQSSGQVREKPLPNLLSDENHYASNPQFEQYCGPLSGPRSLIPRESFGSEPRIECDHFVNGNRKLISQWQVKIDQLGFIGRRP